MTAAASQESKRSWRGAPRGTLVRRSRHFWRWLLSGLALVLIVVAIYWAWPRPLPRTMLLMLTSDREERTLPLLPYVEGDRKALLQWARGAKVPVCQRQLIELTTPRDFVQRLIGEGGAESRFAFTLEDRGTELRLSNSDMLVLYLKGHGLALDVSVAERPDVRPIMIKSLSEADLAGHWWSGEGQTIDVAALLKELSKQPELKKLVILDAVHLNYDPRLGTLINSFPQAVKQAVDQLPQRTNLWVLVGQSDGELGVGMPGTGRSALVDSLVSLLQRNSKGAAAIEIDSLVTKMQSRLNDLAMSGRGSFRQTLQKNFPPSSANVVFRLPTSPPLAADGTSKANSPSAVAAKAAQAVPAASAAVATAQQVAAAPGAKEIQTAVAGTAATQGDAKAPPAAAATPQGQPPATSGTDSTMSVAGNPTAAPATAPPSGEVPKTDLDLAWEARDRLRVRYRDGFSPAQIAPDEWRRVEGLLAGFDEEGLSRERQPRDQATLELLRRDLELLEGVFRGQSGAPSTEQCRTIADALSRFPQTEVYRSFQARKAGGLDAANDALKVLAEGIYRAHDYVWLHGQMLVLLDGGPIASEVPLESLLNNLRTLRALLSPAGLSEGRLTDARLRELSKAAQDVETLRQKIDDEVAAYAKSTAAAPQSPGRQLRAQLLLHSPLLAADVRRVLRSSTTVAGEAKPDFVRSSTFSVSEQLAANLRLSRKLLALALPLSTGGTRDAAKGAASVGLIRLCGSIDSADTKGDLLSWAAIGRRFREQAEELPAAIQAEASSRSTGPAELSAANMFDLYLFTLLIDGRDAQYWRSSRAPLVTLAQPLLPELIADRVDLAGSTQRLKLRGPAGETTSLTLTVQVQSERPPPYPVTLELNWEPRDVEIKRQGGGAALRAGRNDLLLDSDKMEVVLQVISQRDSKEAFTSLVRAQARFASALPARADIACLLPRPDQIDVTVATDENLEAAKRRTWFPHGEQGGKLSFFANRERSYSIYLTNVSSEEKRLTARLYRVPPWAAGPGGRLFDPRATSQLLPAAADLDGRLTQVGADPGQILRGFLVAQSNEKEPLLLTSSGVPLKVPLTAAVAAPMPPSSPGAPPVAKGEDVTDGLLLVLTSADGKGKPFFKWIELQMLQPDDLLEIKDQTYRDGRLSFRVGLKDPKLVEEMGLAKQPLTIAWDGQSLPRAVREATKEAQIAASGATTAEFSATVDPATIRWPIYVQLYVDRDPRGLVASLDRQRDSLTLSNLKENRPPMAHTWRVATVAARSNGPAEKSAVMIRPQAPWLPYPSFATVAEGLPLHEPRQPIMIRVEERTPTVKLEADVGADVAQKYFADGARVRVSVEQQTKDFATDRQIHVRLTGTDGGVLQVASEVSDFTRIEFDPIDVPQDKRIDLVADVVGERVGFSSADSGPDVVSIILDRTPPLIGQPGVQKTDPQAVAPNKPPQSKLIMACRTDDGQGSGISKVEFHMGFDLNRNDRIDENERMLPIPAGGGADGIYSAEYLLPNDPPGEYLLIEAVATDNVGLTSAPARYAFVIPRKVEGGQRTTFGGKKVEEPPMQGKKRP